MDVKLPYTIIIVIFSINKERFVNIYLVLLIALSIGACSNKAIYDNIQLNNRNDCAKLPPSQYDECMERANKSYEEYERERKEALGK